MLLFFADIIKRPDDKPPITFLSLRTRITDLIRVALTNETDSQNTQMLLGNIFAFSVFVYLLLFQGRFCDSQVSFVEYFYLKIGAYFLNFLILKLALFTDPRLNHFLLRFLLFRSTLCEAYLFGFLFFFIVSLVQYHFIRKVTSFD